MPKIYPSSRISWRFSSFFMGLAIILGFSVPYNDGNTLLGNQPQPFYPPDRAVTTSITDPPLGVPSFAWSGVIGATQYRVQVDDEMGFDNPIALDMLTSNPSFTPASNSHLFIDGTWYWRVRVEQPAPAGDWSSIYQFTKTWASLENKPDPLAPADGQSLAFFDMPAFSWTPVIGAAGYRFQIAADPAGFDDPVISQDTLSTSYQPPDRLANGIYYWQVLPMDAADHLGTSSDVRSFIAAYGSSSIDDMVPLLVSPQDESYQTFTPTFHWTAVRGAEKYRLEYTSDEMCDFNDGTSLETRQTLFTPADTFHNDQRYCWHVRAESGPAAGDWSETWHFQKKWDLQPQLLTPTNLYPTTLYPLYSWTPVPGAASYLIQMADNPGFIQNSCYEEKVTPNTTYTPQQKYCKTMHYWWKVTPIDAGGEYGSASNISEYQSDYTSEAPELIYPLDYYIPNDPVYYGDHALNPYEDRTVAYPIFMWHRVLRPSPSGGIYAAAYRIQVDTTPNFYAIVWQQDTENTIAAPTNDFIPVIDQDYYWRVCPLDGMGGNCLTDPDSGLVWWSQVWRTRFNPTYDPEHTSPWVLPPTDGETPKLLSPAHGQESVEATPLLQWWPTLGAGQYQVEVSRDPAFATGEISATVDIPAYSPVTSLAQRSLGRTDYGTFYWRVRAWIDDAWAGWSDTWRFQIASQSDWRYTRTIGNAENRLQIGNDPPADSDPSYDLTTLSGAQSASGWFLGFNAILSVPDMTYAFYIDLDHLDGSGATYPPQHPFYGTPFDVTTIPAHQPEFAIYADKDGGSLSANHIWVFAWEGNGWGIGKPLPEIGGDLFLDGNYVEIKLPDASIGMEQNTGSASIMLFSVDRNTGQVEDSVPSDPGVAPGGVQLSRFSAISERMNLIFPANSASGDPRTMFSFLPFMWDWPIGSDYSTPFAGSRLEIHLDPQYTSLKASYVNNNDAYNSSHFSWDNVTLLSDVLGDNIYYWRVQPRYKLPGQQEVFGVWTGGWSFHRLGMIPENLSTSTTSSTLMFEWDMAEGTAIYRLQISADPNFESIIIDQATPLTSYSPQTTLAQGHYYWRVQVIRDDNIANDWSEVKEFDHQLPTPTGLTPDGDVVHFAPPFCWDHLVGYDDQGNPVLTAWKYRVQISLDPNFSQVYDSIDTFNNCWTPTKGYQDGNYYWHVAMIDGNGRLGPYSDPAATFTKQYPFTTLVSPGSEPVDTTPTFIWTPVDGAASYVLEISKHPTFSPTYDSVATFNTQFTPTKAYDMGAMYYWRVAIRDRDGKQGPFTDSRIIIGDLYPTYLPAIRR